MDAPRYAHVCSRLAWLHAQVGEASKSIKARKELAEKLEKKGQEAFKEVTDGLSESGIKT